MSKHTTHGADYRNSGNRHDETLTAMHAEQETMAHMPPTGTGAQSQALFESLCAHAPKIDLTLPKRR